MKKLLSVIFLAFALFFALNQNKRFFDDQKYYSKYASQYFRVISEELYRKSAVKPPSLDVGI